MERYDAIVLAGGGGQRLGGVDKATLVVGATPLLDRALNAVHGAARIIVVGPARDLTQAVIQVSEDPPGGGPVAAIAAAMPHVDSRLVVVLACDMPFVVAATVERLVVAAGAGPWGDDGSLLVDGEGRRQFLAATYRTGALVMGLRRLGSPHGAAMRNLVRRLTMTEVEADPEVTLDCDTWGDVEHSRDLLEGR